MVEFNLTFGHHIDVEQRVVFEVAARILSTYLTDNTTVDVHILGASGLNEGKAVGGAVPMFHKVHYGTLKKYLEQDASSYIDNQSVLHMQNGNTVDLSAYGEIIEGNTEIWLTRAQAKAIGMDDALLIEESAIWDRDAIDNEGLDGYIVVNQDFEWNNDVLRSSDAGDVLDSLSMAIHELTHVMGFVSGIDGTISINEMLSGDLRVEGTTLFDLRRFTQASSEIENPDGSVSSISAGESAYLSADGGKTSLGELSTGQSTDTGGDGYQASHWKRMQVAMGVMDPTLAYGEQLSLTERDLQALDLLGWDVNYSQLDEELDIESLLVGAEQAVAVSFGLERDTLTEHRATGSIYTMGFSEWWQLFEDQIVEMGFSEWWQVLEAGYDSWETFQESPDAVLQMGFSEWWQSFEITVLNMGFSEWWQTFEDNMLNMGFSEWWQLLEMGFSEWWQQIDTYFSTLEASGFSNENGPENNTITSNSANESVVVSGGDADDILAGSQLKDLISGGGGDDLIDGKDGDDSLLGDAGNDIIYGLEGDDQLYGGEGDDFLAGEADNDKLYGGVDHDILSGGFGNDLLEGNTGHDILKGDAGNDVLDGGDGNDDVSGGDGSDIVVGGEGEDAVSGGRGDDVLYGDLYFVPEESAGDRTEPLKLEEISEQAGFTEARKKPPVDFWVRMEAEDFKLRNFNVEEQSIASGGKTIATGGRGEAKSTFTGPTGIYDIIVGYYDEKDGKGKIKVEAGSGKDKFKFEWLLEEDFGDEAASTSNFVTRTLRGVELESGDDLKIKGDSDSDEFIRLDYIDIISTTELSAYANAEFYNGNLYLESQFKEAAAVEASELGGSLVIEEQENAEAYWLENVFDTTKGIIKVNVEDSRLNLVQDKATRSENASLRIEAEDFDLSGGYKIENRNDYASGKAAIATNDRGGQATTIFTGESGTYNIFVSYVDEGDKSASATFGVNGQTIDEWRFNTNSESAEYRTVSSYFELNKGDSIELEGWADGKEKALIDYVEFVKVSSDNSGSSSNSERSEVLIEAEDLSWHGGKAKSKSASYASESTVIEVEKSTSTTVTFTGESGLYTILIGYADDQGEGQVSATLGDVSLGDWTLDESKKSITSQALATERFVNFGDQLKLSTGEKKFQLDYISFVPVTELAETSSASEDQSSFGQEIYLEAEHMQRSDNAKIEGKDFASNGSYIKLEGEDNRGATATTLFRGETGYYDVIVGYYDGNKGTAELTVQLDGKNLDSWQLDRNFGDKKASEQTFTTRTVASAVKLTRADSDLKIIGVKDGEDKAFVDYIKLVRVAPPGDAATNTDDSSSSDIIRGGEGNDTIYGGEGNDLIYGEDEFDNGLASASNSSDTIYGGSGNDRIEGGSGNDWLDGSDAIAQGTSEYDILGGGLGRDTFVLGNAEQSYYLGDGSNDYARILDFNTATDTLQLHGSSANYRSQQNGNHLELFAGDDLVAVLENISELNLSDSATVTFV